jgi:monoamine oxidase
MTREDFLKNSAILTLGFPFISSLLTGCDKEEILDVKFNGKVLIIGAGSAGLMAGYVLKHYNIDFEILEASDVFGGRVKKTDSFADFPIDLGAEWIHDEPSIFSRLIDGTAAGEIDLIPYNPATIYTWRNEVLKKQNWVSNFYAEYKFKNTTWYDFFDQHIVPEIKGHILYNSPVTDIDYTSDQVSVTTLNQNTFVADKVIVTVPTAVLKTNAISFSPALPAEKIEALDEAYVPAGIKVFIEFSERFYPDITLVSRLLSVGDNEKIFYDAAFKKDSERHILGLFTIGSHAETYTNMQSEEDIIKHVLGELDEMFEGKASETYMKHVIQNWSAEPYIQGSYTFFESNYGSNMEALSRSLDNKVFFAGEAHSDYASATVHGAGLSGKSVAEEILKGA